jgi:hypothetical protein
MENGVFWDFTPCGSCKNFDAAKRIYRCTSFSLLREQIHYTRCELDAVSRELLKLHQLLASTLSAVDWDLIDRITNEKILCLADDVKDRHCRKFMQLHKTQNPTDPPDTSRTVINLSGVPLEEAACSTLSKGLNYAVAPGCIPAKDFLCGVEKAIVTLPEETAVEIRQETVRILKGSRQPKDNLTGAERRALRSLKANASLTVLPADKGNADVVMGTLDYNRKIDTLLQDKAYAMLKKDPTESTERKTVLLFRKSSFPEEVCQQV